MPNVSCSLAVEADIQTIWRVFLDKVEHPERYMAHVEKTSFVEDTDEYAIREIATSDMTLREKITLNEREGEVIFTLLDHPFFEGDVKHAIIPPAKDLVNGLPVVSVTMDWKPKNKEAQMIETAGRHELKVHVEEATKHIKQVAEHLQKSGKIQAPD